MKPPADLEARGRKFWRSTAADFDLSTSELQILQEVCRTLDSLDQLQAAIATNGVMVDGSQGQPVLNPAVTEARGQRALLHRLVAALQLPDEDGKPMPAATSLRGSQAAAARWHGRASRAGA